jgi:hypothetical protein
VYVHGFGSGPRSRKGRRFVEAFGRAGIELELPDLNRPSFEKLSVGAVLEHLEKLVGDDVVRAVGSSFGGWVATRFAQLHPESVDRLVLLCPAFDMASRWPGIVGPEQLARWEKDGKLEFADAEGALRPVHWAFYEEGRKLPPMPSAGCPTLIFHGRKDETVPLASSRRYAAENPQARLVVLDDVHDLLASADKIAAEAIRFLDV